MGHVLKRTSRSWPPTLNTHCRGSTHQTGQRRERLSAASSCQPRHNTPSVVHGFESSWNRRQNNLNIAFPDTSLQHHKLEILFILAHSTRGTATYCSIARLTLLQTKVDQPPHAHTSHTTTSFYYIHTFTTEISFNPSSPPSQILPHRERVLSARLVSYLAIEVEREHISFTRIDVDIGQWKVSRDLKVLVHSYIGGE